MALQIKDRVQETSTTTGTGTLNLAGAVDSFQTFVAGVGDGNTTYYAITDGNGTAWEVGIGTVTDASPDTLSRTTVLASSTGSKISLSSGTHKVFVTYPADKAVFKDANGFVGIGTDSPTYELDVVGDVGVDEYIYHNGDTNTYIRLRGDQFDFVAGGRTMLTLDEASSDIVTVNDGANDVDFQVKGDSDTNLIRTDAANDLVGIGTASPSYKLDVFGHDAWVQASGVIVGASGIVLDSDSSAIKFGDDQEITLTHAADSGLTLKHDASGDNKPFLLTLATVRPQLLLMKCWLKSHFKPQMNHKVGMEQVLPLPYKRWQKRHLAGRLIKPV